MTTSSPTRSSDGYLIQMRSFPCESSPAFEAAWRDLEQRSLHRNPFLSPSFLLPQVLSHLIPEQLRLLTVIDQQGRWLMAGLFEVVSGDRNLPLRHLRAAQTEHTYKTGLLIDATQCESIVQSLWKFLRCHGLHGMTFPLFSLQSSLARLLQEQCDRLHLATLMDDTHSRATVSLHDDPSMSSRRAKSLRRGRRALEKHGPVSLRFATCSSTDLAPIERFLFLESLGWKGRSQSALACQLSEVNAMCSMSVGFAEQDRIRFAELLIDERVIASLCLLRSGSEYSAFKIGWDPQFERGCPGFLLAAEVQEHLNELPGCEQLDSCARPGSFLDHVWPGREQFGTAVFSTTRWGSLAACGTRWVRECYRSWKSTRKTTMASVEAQPTMDNDLATSNEKQS